MRVLHVMPSLAVGRGGPTAVITSLLPALRAGGIDVEVIASAAGLEASEEPATIARFAPVPVTLARVHGPSRAELSPALVPLLHRAARTFDLVHLHTVFTFPIAIGALAARRADVPYVVRPAGTLDDVCLRSRSYPLKRFALATWVRGILDGAAAVHATSALEETELARWTDPARIRRVELGADAIDVPPDHGGRGRHILTVGRLHPLKGLERLIDAVAALDDDVTLVIAGAGDEAYVRTLRDRASARVRFVGHVDGAAKARLLAESDLCVFPSRHESFGVAIVEAMAAGRAVVISDAVGVAAQIAEVGAGLVVVADPSTLAGAMRTLLHDGDARARCASAGKELARARFSWSSAAARTIELYEEILRRPRRSRSIGVTGRASSSR